MKLLLIEKIKKDQNLYKYLRENSHWYKYLNRDSNNIKYLEKEMKEKYKLNTINKIENLTRNINLINTFIDVLK